MAVAVPFALRGPGFVLDDWFLLRNAELHGWWAAAGRDAAMARPGSGAVYALTFGLLGPHPLLHHVVATAVAAATAVLLAMAVERWGGSRRLGIGVALLWLVLPNHQSLTHWATGVAIAVALALLVAGAVVENEWAAAGCLAASVLTYEATAPAAVALVLVGSRLGRRRLLPTLPLLAACAVWLVVFFHPAKAGIDRWADLRQLPPAHVGWGVFPDGRIALALGAAALLGAAAAIVLRRDPAVLSGLALIAIGTLPFLRYFYAPLGAGDRVNVVAGVGTALLWAGLLRHVPPVAPVVVVTALLAGDQGDRAWARAGAEARVITGLLADTTGELVLVGPPPRPQRNVASFLDHSNIEGAAQLARDDEGVVARLATLDAVRSAAAGAAVDLTRARTEPPVPLRIDFGVRRSFVEVPSGPYHGKSPFNR